MTQSIMAGLMIAIAAGMYLKVGGAVGACLFAIGLLTILFFKFHLFTGKAGLLAEKKISGWGLTKVYIGNLIGCYFGTFILAFAGLPIFEAGAAIHNIRITNPWFVNIALGFLCGMLMTIAVRQYEKAPYTTIMCVAGFILLGANHCVADMVYMFMHFGLNGWTDHPEAAVIALLCTTIGNIIGCNTIPLAIKKDHP
jgi:formate/nitrite transporter FocA (FNT family)